MTAKQKHRVAGNTYDLCRKVGIPIEVQLQDDSAFLNEFVNQSGSESGSDADISTDFVIDALASLVLLKYTMGIN